MSVTPPAKIMIELRDFFNDGHGWVCRQCDRELAAKPKPDNDMPRFFLEGESESKSPVLASLALAKWTDKTRRSLSCPRCGLVETVDLS